MLITTLFSTIKILLIFALFFFIIPSLFMKRSNSGLPLLDRYFFGFVCIVLLQEITVHLLVLVKLFDLLSIIALAIITIIIFIKLDKSKAMLITRCLSHMYLVYDAFDSISNRNSLFRKLKASLQISWNRFSANVEKIKKEPIFYILAAPVVVLSAAARFWHALTHYAYPHMDMYQDLKGIKSIMANELYMNGKIYPKGLHSPMTYISKLTFTDPYWISRFFGPFFSLLLVIAIYNLAYKINSNKYLSLLAMAIYGLTINNDILPAQMFRQTATMPQEFGMLFVVLGFAFLLDFIKELSKRHLFAFEACLLVGLMSHSFSGMFLVIWTAITVIFSLILRKMKFKIAVKLVWISALVSAVSCLPLVIGILLGNVFHESSLEMVTDVSNIKILDFNFNKYFTSLLQPKSYLMYLLLLSSIIFLIALFIRKFRVRIRKGLHIYLTLLSSTLLAYMAYQLPNLITAEKLPELLDRNRTGPFLSLLLPIVAVSFVFLIIDIFIRLVISRTKASSNKIKSILYSCTIAAFIIISLTSGSYTLNTFYRHMEYDQAAEAYIRIKSEFSKNTTETGNWYVVATDPQFAEIKNYGWYEEGYVFAQDYTKEEVMNPQFRFDFPVNHIFIFVEKKPLFSTEAITPEYGETKIEPLNDDPFMQFYQDADNRAIMEGHIWMLADAYAKTHNDVSIYYEDDDFMIYRIYQEVVD